MATNADNPEIIEIAMIQTTGRLRYQSLCVPQDLLALENERHGIPQDALENTPQWPEIHVKVLEILRETNLVIGWDIDSHLNALQKTAWRHDMGLPWIDSRDLHKEYRQYMGKAPENDSLDDIAQYCGIHMDGDPHRAVTRCGMIWGILQSVQSTAKQLDHQDQEG